MYVRILIITTKRLTRHATGLYKPCGRKLGRSVTKKLDHNIVLISGYFLCTSEFKLKKLVSVWGQTVFYSVFICVLISVIQMFKGEEVFLLKTLIKSILFGPMSRFSTS